MSDEDVRRKLIDYLDERAFQPILGGRAEDFPESKRGKLEDVQRATKSERERFHGYRSARQVVDMYHDDLNSDAARKVNQELEDLGLPRLSDVRDGFEKLAQDLGVQR